MARVRNEWQVPDYPGPRLLGGTRIALSSSPELSPLAASLEKAGASIHRFERGITSDESLLELWLKSLLSSRFEDVVFFSAQGVRLVCEMAGQLGHGSEVLDALRRTRLIAQGTRTASALAEFGLTATARSKKPGTAALLDVFGALGVTGRVVALEPREGGGDPELMRGLERHGATIHMDQPSLPDAAAKNTLDRILTLDFDGLALFDTAEVTWLWDAALSRGRTGALRESLSRMSVVASDTAAEALRDRGVRARAVPAGSFGGGARLEEVAALFRGSPGTRGRRRSDAAQLLIIGGGIAAQELCERLGELQGQRKYQVSLLTDEALPPYDRTSLTSRFATGDASELVFWDLARYEQQGIRLRLGTRATHLDCDRQVVLTSSGESCSYDVLVLATGAAPAMPVIPGIEKRGVLAYRNVADLEAIRSYAQGRSSAAVIGSGLLGLEVARALRDLGLATQVVESAPRVMHKQLDAAGSDLLRQRLTHQRITTHVGRIVARISGDDRATGLKFSDGSRIDVDLVVVCTGVRPRDELARAAGLDVSDQGGVIVSDALEASDPRVYAIGDCASHRGVSYGLAGPAREMARAVARGLTGSEGSLFAVADVSTKLRFEGLAAASVGDALADRRTGRSIVFSDLARGVYKKLALSTDGERLLGAVLVGETVQYGALVEATKQTRTLPDAPEALLMAAPIRASSAALAE